VKVITPQEMSRIESLAYKEGHSEDNFMEQAGEGIASYVHHFCLHNNLEKKILILCGKGNNAGDAYTAGYYLLGKGYEVQALQPIKIEDCSPLCRKNQARFKEAGGLNVNISQDLNPEFFSRFPLIIDGIFGTGFKGKIGKPFDQIIECTNRSKRPIIAIDIPSGLNGETGQVESIAIHAHTTIFLGLPKLGFFLLDGWNVVGNLHAVDFGLPSHCIENADSSLKMTLENEMESLFPPIVRNRHKYQRGHVIGLGGSPGMPGAALLTSLAALKSGSGIVRLLHPEGMQAELSASPYELIKVSYQPEDFSSVLELMNKASANFVGPGIGKEIPIRNLVKKLLSKLEKPCVIDADALNIISEEDTTIPNNAILTPHLGELLRLMHKNGPQKITLEFLHECQAFIEERNITLILKGGPTFIFHPHSIPIVSIFGDPGMATAGSGDVLTGLLASLLAQGLTPLNAAILGTYIHGRAGEFAAEELSSSCMIASEIIHQFPKVFKKFDLFHHY
jgi:NAD(P)H-hydrate epimerase